MGDTFGKTKVLLYNPNADAINVTVEYLEYSGDGAKPKHYVKNIGSKQYSLTDVIPTYSGASLDGSGSFLALSLTDTESTVENGQNTGSQWYDWYVFGVSPAWNKSNIVVCRGFPVVPTKKLSSQVLIGWGYGCTDKKCYGQKDRSVVWVSPSEDADIYIDLSNSGKPDAGVSLRALQSIKVTDPYDDDMSGALIYAVLPGSGPRGPGVALSAAWGQDPSVSYQYQGISMDLGTTVLPFTTINVAKLVDKPNVRPGEEMQYTIRISNVGQRQVEANSLVLFDALDEDVTYLEGSMKYVMDGVACGVRDDDIDSHFPLDNNGFLLPFDISRRGGSVDIVFSVLVSMNIDKEYVVNVGHLTLDNGGSLPFSSMSVVDMEASITISNTVYAGTDGGEKCGKSEATDVQQGYFGDEVTYCFVVSNTGEASLSAVTIENPDLDFSQKLDQILGPGESSTVIVETVMSASLVNTATVIGNPVFADGRDIESLVYVQASDPSEVEVTPFAPAILLSNTVKRDDGRDCTSSVASLSDIVGTAIEYCFEVGCSIPIGCRSTNLRFLGNKHWRHVPVIYHS